MMVFGDGGPRTGAAPAALHERKRKWQIFDQFKRAREFVPMYFS
jgi:hypothetical protein